jgi:hypothetical protein
VIGKKAFVMLAVTIALGFLDAASATAGSDTTVAAGRMWSRAAWTESIRFSTRVFLAIRRSPKPIMVSSKGGTILGTWNQTVKSPRS